MRAHHATAHAINAHRDLARQTVASAAMTAKPLLRILDPMMALAAECNVNGQGARLKPQPDKRAKAGGKAAIYGRSN